MNRLFPCGDYICTQLQAAKRRLGNCIGAPAKDFCKKHIALRNDNMSFCRLETLIDLHGKAVYNFCRQLSFSREEAEDLYQETFLKAVEKIDKLEKFENPKSFFISLAISIWKSSKMKFVRRRRIAPRLSMFRKRMPLRMFAMWNRPCLTASLRLT